MNKRLKRLKKALGCKEAEGDLFHVAIPVLIASAMALQSFPGALLFLLVWFFLRSGGHA